MGNFTFEEMNLMCMWDLSMWVATMKACFPFVHRIAVS